MTDPAHTNEIVNRLRANLIRSAEGKLRELDLDVLLSNPAPAIDWLWDGYIERGTVNQLHGAGGAGKSILAAALIRAAAQGVPFIGRDTWPSRSVVIDGENPLPEIHRRLERLEYRAVADRVRICWPSRRSSTTSPRRRRCCAGRRRLRSLT